MRISEYIATIKAMVIAVISMSDIRGGAIMETYTLVFAIYIMLFNTGGVWRSGKSMGRETNLCISVGYKR